MTGKAPSVPASLSSYSEAVQAEMRSVLKGREGPLYTMVRYHLGWTDRDGKPETGEAGKGLRSTLCLLSAEAAGGQAATVLPAAAALELVHNFSLVHDDIQDQSPERHHRSTVWRVFGEAQAINAGDALFALARLALLRLTAPAELTSRLCGLLDEACLRLCEGQQMDLAFQDRDEVAVDDYLAMIEGKTGALIATACQIGAALGSPDRSLETQFREAGRQLGLAFQIRDDVLGIWGSASSLGKPVMEDVWERKKSLPVVVGLQRAVGADRRELLDVYTGRGPLDGRQVERVVALLDDLGAREQCQSAASEHASQAVETIRKTGCDNEASDRLIELAQFAAEREY